MKIVLIIILAIILLLVVLYFALIGNIDKSEPEIVKFDSPVLYIGRAINTSDKDIYKDVGKVAKEFNAIKQKNSIPYLKDPWASVCVSKDYNKETKTFTYIIGDVVTKIDSIPEGLQAGEIPALTYAVFKIRSKSKIGWGLNMGRMKRFIYTKWLPTSGYELSDSFGDFELHDDRSLGKKPEINLHVALKDKQDR